MSELRHTPGPWTFGGPVDRDHPNVAECHPLREKFWEISGPRDYSTPGIAAVNSEADARLIAAAPTLLTALTDMLAWTDELTIQGVLPATGEHWASKAARSVIQEVAGGE